MFLNWVQLRGLGRKEDRGDVGGHVELARRVPSARRGAEQRGRRRRHGVRFRRGEAASCRRRHRARQGPRDPAGGADRAKQIGVDAPMSVKSWLRRHRLGLAWRIDTQRSLERRRFEAAYDFGFGLALRGAAADVIQCRLVAAHTDDDYPIEGGIGLPVASTVEAVPMVLPLDAGIGQAPHSLAMLPPSGCAQGCRRQAAASRPQCPRRFRAPPAVLARGRP